MAGPSCFNSSEVSTPPFAIDGISSKTLAARRGVTPAHIATAWVAGSPRVTSPLIGADAPDQVDIAVAAAALNLDADEKAFLEAPYRPRDEINDYNPVRRPRALGPH